MIQATICRAVWFLWTSTPGLAAQAQRAALMDERLAVLSRAPMGRGMTGQVLVSAQGALLDPGPTFGNRGLWAARMVVNATRRVTPWWR